MGLIKSHWVVNSGSALPESCEGAVYAILPTPLVPVGTVCEFNSYFESFVGIIPTNDLEVAKKVLQKLEDAGVYDYQSKFCGQIIHLEVEKLSFRDTPKGYMFFSTEELEYWEWVEIYNEVAKWSS